jgi:sec-independent protein translocase protein TatC
MPLDQDKTEVQEGKSMTFFEHIEELRWHLVRSVIALVLCSVVGFIYGTFIFDEIIFGPVNKDFFTYRVMCKASELFLGNDTWCISEITFSAQNISLSGQLIQHFKVALISGLILSFPYILYQLWVFIKPALKESERNKTTGIVLVSSLLFFIGVLFGYLIITPLSVNFLVNYSVSERIVNHVTLESYISFVTLMSLITGLVFELPLLIYFMAKLGVISSAFLKKYRRHSIVVTLILSAIITPSADMASQLLLAIPIYFLYEIGILVARRVEQKREDQISVS